MILISLAPMVVVTIVGQLQVQRIAEDLSARNTEQVMTFIEHYFQETRQDVLAIARNYAQNEELNAVFRSGDRDRLDAMIKPIFENLNLNNSITVFEYGNADGVVFTRGHHPGKYDDNKSSNPSIAAALQGEVVSGFEFGSSGLAIRAFLPVVYDSRIIGTFQTGFNLSGQMLSELNHLIQGDIALYQKEVLDQTSRADEVELIGTHSEPEIFDRLVSGEQCVETLSDNHFQQTYIPLYDPFGETIQGMIRVGRDVSDVYAGIERSLLWSVLTIAMGAVTVMVVAFVLGRVIVTPINLVKDSMRDISVGDGDLSRSLAIKRHDEIGELAHYFNDFLEKLNGIVANIRRQVQDADGRGSQLLSSMDATKLSAQEILTATREIRDTIMDQSATVTEVSAAVEQIARTIENQDMKIESQSANVIESSSAIEQMIANIKSISDNLNTSATEFNQLEQVVDEGSRHVTTLTETIASVSRQSEQVAEANKIITGIAAQTNLLSMNAAIEAAHAGEFGRGFSVVADEVRKLSEVANQQSGVIAKSLKDLKEIIESAVSVSASTGKAFESIVSTVKTVTDIETEIAGALEEQAAGSTQVLKALSDISRITDEVHAGSSEMLAGSKSVLDEIAGLVSKTERIRESASIVAGKTESVNENVVASAGLLNDATTTISEIREQVARFKLTEEAV
jgi:methyl-accepting chemotaxis protein